MVSYVKDFVRYNRNNEVGFALLMITVILTAAYIAIGLAAFLQGATIVFGWWATIPVALWLVTVAHLMLRPVVSKFYANK